MRSFLKYSYLKVNDMTRRMTDGAVKIMQRANQIAHSMNHEWVDPIHILQAICQSRAGMAYLALTELKADLRQIRAELEMVTNRGEQPSVLGALPPNAKTSRVLQYANEESEQLEHHYLGTEHILLGILRLSDCEAAEILMNNSIMLTFVREKLTDLLSDPAAPGFEHLRLDLDPDLDQGIGADLGLGPDPEMVLEFDAPKTTPEKQVCLQMKIFPIAITSPEEDLAVLNAFLREKGEDVQEVQTEIVEKVMYVTVLYEAEI